MNEVFVIDAVRTPVGRRKGSLGPVHPADLGASVLSALVKRTDVDPGAVDDVIMGCVDNIGPQAGNVARTAWLAANLPEHVPAVTIDRQCGSSQQAVHFGALGVMSGTQELVVAGGIQNMTAIPIAASIIVGQQFGFTTPVAESVGWQKRYGDQEVSQFRSAEMIAEKWGLSREAMEQFALQSHQRAIHAWDEGRFEREVVALDELAVDEGPRRDTSIEKMAALAPVTPDGRITAAVSSQISDGASAVLLASERAVREHGLTPRARIHRMAVRGDDPIWMLTAPIEATRHVLSLAGLSVDDIDLFECNEAFASVSMAWAKELGVPAEKMNVNGGAIAIGHPIGASGTRIFATLLSELERTQGRFGLMTMCEGGGTANATIIERL